MSSLLEVLDLLPVPVAVARITDEYITYANLALVALVRAEGPHDVVGHRVARFIHPEDLERVEENIRVVSIGGVPSGDIRCRFRRLDDSEGVAEVHSVPIEHHEERVLLSVILDVTARVEEQRGRAAADERYRSLFEMAPDGLVVQVDGRCVFANPELARMAGVASPADLVGVPIVDLIAPHDRARAERSMRGAGEYERASLRGRFEMMAKDGQTQLVEVSATPIEFDGRTGTHAIIRRVVGDDGVVETRWMREPVEALLAASAALLQGIDGPVGESQQQRVRDIVESAEHLRALIGRGSED